MQGSGDFSVANVGYLGKHENLPSRYQEAFVNGVNFFEVRYHKKIEYPITVFNFFDVKCQLRQAMGGQFTVHFETISDARACVRYEVANKYGLAIAWIPEDKYRHNRMMIAMNGLEVFAYHTNKGAVQGGEIMAEINALREELKEERKKYHLVQLETGAQIDEGWVKADLEKKKVEIEEKKGKGTLEIKQSMQFDTKPHVLDVIRKYSKSTFGWTDSPEWRDEIYPGAVKRFKKNSAAGVVGADDAGELLSAIKSLPKETMAELRKLLIKKAEPVDVVEYDEDSAPPEIKPSEETRSLKKKNLAELQEIAIEKGIDVTDKTKAEIVEAILAFAPDAEEEIS